MIRGPPEYLRLRINKLPVISPYLQIIVTRVSGQFFVFKIFS
jgi:hypothetical protein